ncbi:cytochrome c oxidase assembly protein [Nocardia panacis]|uniref:Cytochrome c oxidase assembly protein n=1 Tax=Nocardia panacis TaxID=2340916 RepID=A0A3A4KKU4_9NOCA|nr:cytochrome c oxidase assembly protein [Nocardia panacis]RJO73617.1 cytochrome c oxidase assembly protein [Nocardia panacis]
MMDKRWQVAAAVLISVLVLGTFVAAGAWPYASAGTAYPGPFDAALYSGLRAVADIAGALTLGALVYALCASASTKRLDVNGYAGMRLVERASLVWVMAAVALIPVAAAQAGGMTTATLLRTGALVPLLEASEKPKAWVVAAVFAAVIGVVSRITLSWNGSAILTWIAVLGVLPASMVGNAGEGPDHDYGTGAMVVFRIAISVLPGLLWCTAEHLWRGAESEIVLRRCVLLVRLCLGAATVSGLVLVAVLLPPAALPNTGYGRLALSGVAAAAAIALLVRGNSSMSRIAWAAAVSIIGQAIVVAMALRPAPAFADRKFTAQQVFLGFDLPHAPTVMRLITLWRFDIVLGTAALAGSALYVAGVLRLRGRGDEWSRWRTTSWIIGWLALLLATSSGLGSYGYGMFSMHMIQHMVLNMFVPVLLVLGAPVTLLLRAVAPAPRGGPPGVREWVLSLLHSRATAIASHPGIALALFALSPYALYFTPLFDALIRYHWGHLAMNVHFLLVGYLFYWGIIGIDPGPRRLPHLGRLGMLFAVMPFHAFFGIAVMSMTTVIGDRFYPQLELNWPIDLLSDQHTGGGIAWVSGEVPILLVVGALLTQWVAQDRRTATRTDRRDEEYGDSDLAAYNAMLEQLARTRR